MWGRGWRGRKERRNNDHQIDIKIKRGEKLTWIEEELREDDEDSFEYRLIPVSEKSNCVTSSSKKWAFILVKLCRKICRVISVITSNFLQLVLNNEEGDLDSRNDVQRVRRKWISQQDKSSINSRLKVQHWSFSLLRVRLHQNKGLTYCERRGVTEENVLIVKSRVQVFSVREDVDRGLTDYLLLVDDDAPLDERVGR
jgi:hypothetical protein